MNAVTASQSAFRVWGGQTGLQPGRIQAAGQVRLALRQRKPTNQANSSRQR